MYELVDPRNEEVFYVGETSGHKFARLGRHICDSFCEDVPSPKAARIIELVNGGILPVIRVLEEVYDLRERLDRETYWIDKRKLEGCVLLNVDSTEHRRRISEANRAASLRKTPEERSEMSRRAYASMKSRRSESEIFKTRSESSRKAEATKRLRKLKVFDRALWMKVLLDGCVA